MRKASHIKEVVRKNSTIPFPQRDVHLIQQADL